MRRRPELAGWCGGTLIRLRDSTWFAQTPSAAMMLAAIWATEGQATDFIVGTDAIRGSSPAVALLADVTRRDAVGLGLVFRSISDAVCLVHPWPDWAGQPLCTCTREVGFSSLNLGPISSNLFGVTVITWP